MAEERSEARLAVLRERFRAKAAEDLQVVYQFHLLGPDGGDFWLRVERGGLEAGCGVSTEPDVTYRADAADYEAVLAGRENAEMLVMGGRIQVEGDPRLATRIRSLF